MANALRVVNRITVAGGMLLLLLGLWPGFVVYPSIDCGISHADARTGQVLDRFNLEYPPEVALYTLPNEPTVVLPLGAVTAFEVVA